ncbi:MAG: NUDIX hydrolase [Sedimentitalea sp.]
MSDPRLGAIAVVLRGNDVLLAQRRNPPDAGKWGFPGGHVEWGETALDAAVRELREETNIVARAEGYLTNIDLIQTDPDGTTVLHYLLAAVVCTYVSGTPQAADDVSAAAWVPLDDIRAARLEMSERVGALCDLALAARDAR